MKKLIIILTLLFTSALCNTTKYYSLHPKECVYKVPNTECGECKSTDIAFGCYSYTRGLEYIYIQFYGNLHNKCYGFIAFRDMFISFDPDKYVDVDLITLTDINVSPKEFGIKFSCSEMYKEITRNLKE